jgi:hypothetical protein
MNDNRVEPNNYRPDDLPMWAIYRRPRDYPDGYVARLWLIRRRTEVPLPTNVIVTAPTLAGVRAKLPPGLVCLPRQPGDDPKIVETWT